MSQGNTASALYTMNKGVYPVVWLGVVRSPQSTESSSDNPQVQGIIVAISKGGSDKYGVSNPQEKNTYWSWWINSPNG